MLDAVNGWIIGCLFFFRWFHPECERPGEGHAHPQSKEDHKCSICRNAGFESDPAPVDAEGIQAEIQSHVEEENAQPVPSNESEPAKVQDAEPHQPVSEMPSEEKQLEEKQMTGKTHHFSAWSYCRIVLGRINPLHVGFMCKFFLHSQEKWKLGCILAP